MGTYLPAPNGVPLSFAIQSRKKSSRLFKKKSPPTQLRVEVGRCLPAPNGVPISFAIQSRNPPHGSFKKKPTTNSIAGPSGQVPTCTQREPPLSCDPSQLQHPQNEFQGNDLFFKKEGPLSTAANTFSHRKPHPLVLTLYTIILYISV